MVVELVEARTWLHLVDVGKIPYPRSINPVAGTLKSRHGSGDFCVGSRRFSPVPTVSDRYSTGSLPPDS